MPLILIPPVIHIILICILCHIFYLFPVVYVLISSSFFIFIYFIFYNENKEGKCQFLQGSSLNSRIINKIDFHVFKTSL